MQAIIFDFFGVISLHARRLFFETYIPHFAERHQKFQELTHAHNLGLISPEEYIQRISEETGFSTTECLARMQEERTLNTQLLEYIRSDLKPHYKLGMLSNAGSELVQYINPKELHALFNEVVISADVGLVKPDPQIYHLACQRLAVSPAAALMVDDIQTNCDGAQQAGLQAIRYLSLPQLKQDLAQVL